MDALAFTKMLSDKHFFDLRRMQYKYGSSAVQELINLLYHADSHMAVPLPIHDFSGTPMVYLPGLAQINLHGAKRLMVQSYGNEGFGLKAMEEEIHSTLSIEDIHSSRESIRKILKGQAPVNESERSLYGMKQGLDFISDPAHSITEENLYRLYQMTVGDFLDEDCRLLPDHLYRHDSVYVVGGSIEHRGLPAAQLPDRMDQLFSFISANDQMDDLHKAAAIHFALAYLHPYFDGNGRTARFVHLWYLVQQGYPAALYSPLSHYIQSSKSAYYKAFSLIEENAKISGVLDITPFLCYFAENVYNQLGEDTPNAAQTFEIFENALKAGKITQKEKALWEFVLSAYGGEEFSTKQLEKDFGNAAYATIRSFVLKFTDLQLLESQAYGSRIKYRVK